MTLVGFVQICTDTSVPKADVESASILNFTGEENETKRLTDEVRESACVRQET